MKLYVYVVLFVLALTGTSHAVLDYVYKDGSTWMSMRVDDTLIVTKTSPNSNCNNLNETPVANQGGTFGLTDDGKLIWITGDKDSGFTITEIAAGPYKDIDTFGPDAVSAVGASGADIYYWDGSSFVAHGHADPGTGDVLIISHMHSGLSAGYDNFFPLAVDSANSVLFNWGNYAVATGPSSAAYVAGAWTVDFPASAVEVKSVLSMGFYLGEVLFANGRLAAHDWAGGAIGDYDKMTTATMMLRPGFGANSSPFVVSQQGAKTEFGQWTMAWYTPPMAYAKLVDLNGTYVAGINSAPWNDQQSPFIPDVFFLANSVDGSLERVAVNEAGEAWEAVKVLDYAGAGYKWLGAAGTVDTLFGSYDVKVPVELADFQIQ